MQQPRYRVYDAAQFADLAPRTIRLCIMAIGKSVSLKSDAQQPTNLRIIFQPHLHGGNLLRWAAGVIRIRHEGLNWIVLKQDFASRCVCLIGG